MLREAARLDRTQSDPAVAARNAFGVAAPLAVGVLLGNIALGLAAAVGALQTAFADRPGPYRLRMVRMLGTATAAGVTSGLAVLASRNDGASVVLLLVLSFGAGLLLAGGPSATQVGVAAVAAALVLGHLPQPPSAALHVALLVLAGGAGQAALAIAAWPLRRHRPERIALAGLYREIAIAARTPQGTRAGPPASTTLTEVRQSLYGLGHDHGPSVEAYRVLLDEAERIRRETVVIIGLAERLAAKGNPILAGLVRESCTAAGGVLDEIADASHSPGRSRPRSSTGLATSSGSRYGGCGTATAHRPSSPGRPRPRDCGPWPGSCARPSRAPAPVRARAVAAPSVATIRARGCAIGSRPCARVWRRTRRCCAMPRASRRWWPARISSSASSASIAVTGSR